MSGTRALAAVLLGAIALSPARAARALEMPIPMRELTIDVDAASIGVTYAHRHLWTPLLLGGGGGVGLSPILGSTWATGTHFDSAPHVNLLEIAHVQAFARSEMTTWLHLDGGVRAGAFIHGNEDYTGGGFAALFLAPGLVWRWLWIGPRVSAGVLAESGHTAAALTIDYVMARATISW